MCWTACSPAPRPNSAQSMSVRCSAASDEIRNGRATAAGIEASTPAAIHIDTGMNRLGTKAPMTMRRWSLPARLLNLSDRPADEPSGLRRYAGSPQECRAARRLHGDRRPALADAASASPIPQPCSWGPAMPFRSGPARHCALWRQSLRRTAPIRCSRSSAFMAASPSSARRSAAKPSAMAQPARSPPHALCHRRRSAMPMAISARSARPMRKTARSACLGDHALPIFGRVSMDLNRVRRDGHAGGLASAAGLIELIGERFTVDDAAATRRHDRLRDVDKPRTALSPHLHEAPKPAMRLV